MNGITSCLTGRVGTEPDFRYSAAGNPFMTFSVAADDAKRGDDDPTEWVRVAVFGELAESLHGKLSKGQRVYAEGRVRLEQWQARTGEQRAGLKLAAWVVQPLGLESRRPRQEDQQQPRRMPEAVAVAGPRNTRQALGLDDDMDEAPF